MKVLKRSVSLRLHVRLSSLTGVLGVSHAQQAAAPKEVRIGVCLPMSGIQAEVGKAMAAGIEFVNDQILKAGGIKSMGGAKVQLVYGDTTSEPKVAAAEMERLIIKEKVPMVLGPYTTGECSMVAPVAETHKVPILSIESTGDPLYPKNYYYWRTLAMPSWEYGRTFAKWLHELVKEYGVKADRIAIVYDDNATLRVFGEATKSYLNEIGWSNRLVSEVYFDPKAPELATTAAAIKAAEPDAVIGPVLFAPAMVMLRAFDAVGLYPRIQIGPDLSLGTPKAFNALGPELANKMLMRPGEFFTAYFAAKAPRKEVQDFLNLAKPYAASKGYPALEVNFVTGAQAGYVLWRILETTGSTDPQVLNEALHKLEMREGDPFLIGQCWMPMLKWHPNGKPVNAELVLCQWNGTEQEIIYPKSLRTAEPRLP